MSLRRRVGRRVSVAVLVLVALAPALSSAQGAEPTPRPLTLVDIGPVFGLSRNTNSWDFVVGQANADGIPDLVIADHQVITVYLNRQPGLEQTFRWDPADPHGCTLSDIDGNGLGDIYCTLGVVHGSGRRSKGLFLQESDGIWNRTTVYGVDDEYGRGRRTTFIDLDHRGGLDLFVGNLPGRTDDQLSINRTFVDSGSLPMTARNLGPLGNKGAVCAQAVDQNADGWEDLLLCGGGDQPGLQDRLYLYRNLRTAAGGRRLVDVADRLGIAAGGVRSARLAHLNGDQVLDLVVVTNSRVSVLAGRQTGGFTRPRFEYALTAGNWVAVGDVGGGEGQDLFIVQRCVGVQNRRDVLLVHQPGWHYRVVQAPAVNQGCGDTAAMIDLDGDGADEVVVGNGRWSHRGPIQVLTAGLWRG